VKKLTICGKSKKNVLSRMVYLLIIKGGVTTSPPGPLCAFDLTPRPPLQTERGRMGEWEIGRMGDWETGRLGDWGIGRLGDWERYWKRKNSVGV
jgi:hypothetical protein